MDEIIIDSLLSEIEDAFMSHFGFSIRDVQDTEELEHIVVEGDSIESFRYRGETFLYYDTNSDLRIEETDGCLSVIMTTRFKKV